MSCLPALINGPLHCGVTKFLDMYSLQFMKQSFLGKSWASSELPLFNVLAKIIPYGS